MTDQLVVIDASTYQQPLLEVAETVAQKVYREGGQHLNAPAFVTTDLFVMLRQAMYTFYTLSLHDALPI